ncbi:MAG: type II secretion system protein [Patescibacteria group bacterium]
MQSFKKNNSGFTLIELLVVISIIGILSSMTVVSLNDARAKARDAKRLNDVRQIANVMAIAATEGSTAAPLVGCNAASEEKNTRSCTGPESIAVINRFSDPSISNPDNNNTICHAGTTAPCQYSLSVGSTNVENAKVYFFLETNVAGLESRLHAINAEGVVY